VLFWAGKTQKLVHPFAVSLYSFTFTSPESIIWRKTTNTSYLASSELTGASLVLQFRAPDAHFSSLTISGVEASAATSNSNNGAPEPGRVLSLLSDGSWGSSSAVIQQTTSHADAGALPPLATVAVSNAAAGHPLDPSPGRFWQDDHPPLDGAAPQIQELAHLRTW
jgi:hypothetical protein